MEYIIGGTICFIAVYLVASHLIKTKSKNGIDEIRRNWGNPKSKKSNFNFARVVTYANTSKEKFHRLTDQTIEDIDFKNVFMFIDRTTSRVGQQFLFKKLIEPTNHIKDPSSDLIKLFKTDKSLREKVQLELLKLNNDDAYSISSLLNKRSLEKPKWFGLLTLDIILVLSLIALSFISPVFAVALILPATTNMFLHLWNKNNTFHFNWSIPQLNLLIEVCKKMTEYDKTLFDQTVIDSISELKSFQQKAKFIKFNEGGSQLDFMQYFFDMIKAFFLIEVFMVYKIAQELKDKKSSIQILFEYVGNIDASISIISLREGKAKTCIPELTSPVKEIEAKNIYHPLIKNCVENSLSINKKSILITGSNMSGKSTFLRTLAINSILAQTIYTCFADEFRSPILKQFSSIRIDDNIFEGKSYYFEEVGIMKSLISEAGLPDQRLILLDELFKGTNTVERIAAAKAILSYLNNSDNIVIISTHDIELASLLKGEYDLYHFTETIESDKLLFDHTIKSGPVKTRNAIKILELSNYPTSIISEAKSIIESIK